MDIVYFDLETQRTANDAGGWDKKAAMGMSTPSTTAAQIGQMTSAGRDSRSAVPPLSPIKPPGIFEDA